MKVGCRARSTSCTSLGERHAVMWSDQCSVLWTYSLAMSLFSTRFRTEYHLPMYFWSFYFELILPLNLTHLPCNFRQSGRQMTPELSSLALETSRSGLEKSTAITDREIWLRSFDCVYVRLRTTALRGTIYYYELNSAKLQTIGSEDVAAECPTFSPDGKTLVYFQRRADGPHQAVMECVKVLILPKFVINKYKHKS